MLEKKTQQVELSMNGDSTRPWSPTEGSETSDLLAHFHTKSKGRFDLVAQRNLVKSTTEILAKCVTPTGPVATATGLVIGYVQSGKTMSFTTVAAMAVDSGYRVVIVITGTTDLLYGQSASRLNDDLRHDPRTARKWKHFREPGPNDRDQLVRMFDAQQDETIPPQDRRVVLITVKKNWQVLDRLVDLLKPLNLKSLPTLIIDDEADQASLNGQARQGGVTTTYESIRALRNLFSTHTFLGYTATPQANLLINILDILSPDFAVLLSPGDDYTGGIEFFDEEQRYIEEIPPSDTPTRQNPLQGPPDSLLEAMRIFFVGVAAGYVLGETMRGYRTMLIHPSWGTALHSDYARWVSQLMTAWIAVLGSPDSEPDKHELIEEFQEAYENVAETVGASMPEWEAIRAALRRAIIETSSNIVNATPQSIKEILWEDEYSWILIGGNKLNRGFTVEGLTVTYMPRGLGSGNADTVQQRARFFGYKRSYLGYCRIYMDSSTIDAFIGYVVDEENYRKQLDEFKDRPLNEWKRGFLTASGLRPTRKNIMVEDYLRGVYSDSWFEVKSPQESEDSMVSNRLLFDEFVKDRCFQPLPPELYGNVAARHSGAIGISLKEVHEGLLVRTKVPDVEDSQGYIGVALQITHFLEDNPNEICDVYLMNPDGDSRRRIDSTTEQIQNIFQGPNRAAGDPSYYPGDRQIHPPQRLTVQLRRLTLTTETGEVVATDVPVLAIWVPAKMGVAWAVQEPPPSLST